jgi:hypothetical protein
MKETVGCQISIMSSAGNNKFVMQHHTSNHFQDRPFLKEERNATHKETWNSFILEHNHL